MVIDAGARVMARDLHGGTPLMHASTAEVVRLLVAATARLAVFARLRESRDPVLAAADGRVVYAGSGLRGYGNLIILKHNPTYLTAYAHNQTLLVKDDQAVKKGQNVPTIGDMTR